MQIPRYATPQERLIFLLRLLINIWARREETGSHTITVSDFQRIADDFRWYTIEEWDCSHLVAACHFINEMIPETIVIVRNPRLIRNEAALIGHHNLLQRMPSGTPSQPILKAVSYALTAPDPLPGLPGETPLETMIFLSECFLRHIYNRERDGPADFWLKDFDYVWGPDRKIALTPHQREILIRACQFIAERQPNAFSFERDPFEPSEFPNVRLGMHSFSWAVREENDRKQLIREALAFAWNHHNTLKSHNG